MKSLAINALSIGAADIGIRLLSFITITYLARTLGPADLGVLAVGMAILTYASVISNMGLPILGVRSIASKTNSPQHIVKTISSAQFILSIIIFITSGR